MMIFDDQDRQGSYVILRFAQDDIMEAGNVTATITQSGRKKFIIDAYVRDIRDSWLA